MKATTALVLLIGSGASISSELSYSRLEFAYGKSSVTADESDFSWHPRTREISGAVQIGSRTFLLADVRRVGENGQEFDSYAVGGGLVWRISETWNLTNSLAYRNFSPQDGHRSNIEANFSVRGRVAKSMEIEATVGWRGIERQSGPVGQAEGKLALRYYLLPRLAIGIDASTFTSLSHDDGSAVRAAIRYEF